MRVRFFQPTDEQETAQFSGAREEDCCVLATVSEGVPQAGSGMGWGLAARAQSHRRSLGARNRRRFERASRDNELEKLAYVVSLEGPTYRPLVQAVVAQAPSIWPWIIAAEREPIGLEQALQRVFTDTRFDLKVARARVGVGRGHGIEVVIGHHLFHGTQDDTGGQVGEQLVTTLLGDEVFDHWVTSVEIVAAPRPSPLRLLGQDDSGLQLGIAELQAAVSNAIMRITDSLPEEPLHVFCDRADWVLFEMDDLRAGEDVSGLPLPDLQMATTMCPEMLKSYLSAIPFSSRRFSQHGERFVYLELEGDGASEAERLEHRLALEEALDYALVPGRLGCVVGAGVGTRYMYVFLALQNLKPALATVNKCLLTQLVGFDARLRFCDDEWASEWVDIQRLASE